MIWPDNANVLWKLRQAEREQDAQQMRLLLTSHPEFQHPDPDYDFWLHSASRQGSLPIVRMLVEDLEFDVNLPSNKHVQDGAINAAVCFGHLDVAEYLLCRGAQINHLDVDGKTSCPTLHIAAGQDDIEMVKILVAHGADVHSAPMGINAMMEAEFNDSQQVAKYLRSIGLKDLRETTPPDYVQAHQKVVSIAEGLWGAAQHLETLPGERFVEIYITTGKTVKDEDAFEPSVHGPSLFTVGLSDRFLPKDGEPFNCVELEMHLAPSWPVSELTKDDSEWNWPLVWIKKIAESLQSAESFEYPAYFMNGDPPKPLTRNSSLCGWVGLRSSQTYRQFTDYRWFSFLHLHPIRPEEQGMIGYPEHESLVIRLEEELGLPSWIVADRASIKLSPDKK